MNLYIEAHPLPGTSLKKAIADAIELAGRLEICVCVRHSRNAVFVSGGDDASEVYARALEAQSCSLA